MTISTGSFDEYGIPQGAHNMLDDLADVDVEEANDGEALTFKGGRWVPIAGITDTNEVTIHTDQPTDGSELWMDLDDDTGSGTLDHNMLTGRDDPAAHLQYVLIDGSRSMTGDLQMDGDPAPARGIRLLRNALNRWFINRGNAAESGNMVGSDLDFSRYDDTGTFKDIPFRIYRNTGATRLLGQLLIDKTGNTTDAASSADSINIKQGTYPSIRLVKTDGAADYKQWRVYVSGAAGDTGSGASSLTFLAEDDLYADQATFRMHRDGRMVIGANPVNALDAATKQYADGSGAFVSVTYAVPSSATTMTHIATVDQAGAAWGPDVAVSGGSIICKKDGYYQCSFQAGFSSNGNGTVRALVLGDYDNGQGLPPYATNVNNIGQYATVTANTSGVGAVMSAVGIWWVPANHRIVLRGRQDSGASLNATGTIFVRSLPGSS